jgi:uncharacterized protein (DUF1501 family)
MPTKRREFLKRSACMTGATLFFPQLLVRQTPAQTSASGRKIFVVVQFFGGNDGLNTVIPYDNARYFALRPTLAVKETELKDEQGRSTIISERFGFHPAMGDIKQLYDQGKVAVVLGAGYPNMTESHFLGERIWSTARTDGALDKGWLGKYADLALAGQSSLAAVAIAPYVPQPAALRANRTVPTLEPANLERLNFQTDFRHFPADGNNRINSFRALQDRYAQGESFVGALAKNGLNAIETADRLKMAQTNNAGAGKYSGDRLAVAFRLAAQLIKLTPDVNLVYLTLLGFDLHARQKEMHAALLSYFSKGIKAFYDDLRESGLAENLLILQWSEFGRRPDENSSAGTDHGTAGHLFIIGDPVQGGLYGDQPSLAAADLDFGQMRFGVDFRRVYATILDRWLEVDSRLILNATFENLGFLD